MRMGSGNTVQTVKYAERWKRPPEYYRVSPYYTFGSRIRNGSGIVAPDVQLRCPECRAQLRQCERCGGLACQCIASWIDVRLHWTPEGLSHTSGWEDPVYVAVPMDETKEPKG